MLFGFDDPDDLGEAQRALLARHGPTAWPASRIRAVAGGPRAAAADAVACLEVLCGSAKLGGVVVTEVSPDTTPTAPSCAG